MSEYLLSPVFWLVVAVVCAGIEILTWGFAFAGIAAGALATAGFVLAFGGALPDGEVTRPTVVLLVFAAASLASWGVIRRLAGVWPGQDRRVTDDVNEN